MIAPDITQVDETVRRLLDDRDRIWNQTAMQEMIEIAYAEMVAQLPFRVAQLLAWQKGWTELGDRICPGGESTKVNTKLGPTSRIGVVTVDFHGFVNFCKEQGAEQIMSRGTARLNDIEYVWCGNKDRIRGYEFDGIEIVGPEGRIDPRTLMRAQQCIRRAI